MELYIKNIENRALPSLHQKSLEITLTVHLNTLTVPLNTLKVPLNTLTVPLNTLTAPLNTTKVEIFVLVNP